MGDILQNTTQIASKVSRSFFERDFGEWFLDLVSIVAGIVTIIAIVSVVFEYRKMRTSKKMQARILEDIERYLFGNDVFIEVIRLKMTERGWDPDCHPVETVIRRFALPESDLNIGKFSSSAVNYETLHEFITYLRNYNISSQVTAQHFEKPNEKRIRINDLIDLQYRSERLLYRINDKDKGLRNKLHLPIKPLYDVVIQTHRGHFNPWDLSLDETERQRVQGIIVPETYIKAGLEAFYKKCVADRYTWFYDIEILPLPKDYNDDMYRKRKPYTPNYQKPGKEKRKLALQLQQKAVNMATGLTKLEEKDLAEQAEGYAVQCREITHETLFTGKLRRRLLAGRKHFFRKAYIKSCRRRLSKMPAGLEKVNKL